MKKKRVGNYKRTKKVITITHKYSIGETEQIIINNNYKYIRKIVELICDLVYQIDKTQVVSVKQIVDILVKHYYCKRTTNRKIKVCHKRIDLYDCETAIIDQNIQLRIGLRNDICKIIKLNKANDYCHIDR